LLVIPAIFDIRGEIGCSGHDPAILEAFSGVRGKEGRLFRPFDLPARILAVQRQKRHCRAA
jgi:hypothetical protein